MAAPATGDRPGRGKATGVPRVKKITRRGPKPKPSADVTAAVSDGTPRVSDNFGRFVGRAKALIEDDAFHSAVQDARKNWNARFGHYAFAHAIADPLDDPAAVTTRMGSDVFFPFKLDRALPKGTKEYWHWRYFDRPRPDDTVRIAHNYWIAMILSMCRTWWPEGDYYATWCDPNEAHPAMCFVSACTIWNVSLFDDSYADAFVDPHRSIIKPSILPFDPSDKCAVTELVYWQGFTKHFTDHLAAIVSSGTAVTMNDLADARDGAHNAALQRWDMAATDDSVWPRHFPVLPLKAGMTQADIKAVASLAEMTSAAHFGRRDDHISNLDRAGLNQDEIARRLGMTRQGVAKPLKRRRTTDATK